MPYFDLLDSQKYNLIGKKQKLFKYRYPETYIELTEAQNGYNKIGGFLNGIGRDENLLNALESFVQTYKEEQGKKDNPMIPVSIFSNRELGVLEILIKCLRENFSMRHCKIAKLINRDDRTVWATYSKAIRKHKENFLLKQDKYLVPVSIFAERELGPLEALIIYMRDDLHLGFKEISKLLDRSYRTAWLSYHNGMKKRKPNA